MKRDGGDLVGLSGDPPARREGDVACTVKEQGVEDEHFEVVTGEMQERMVRSPTDPAPSSPPLVLGGRGRSLLSSSRRRGRVGPGGGSSRSASGKWGRQVRGIAGEAGGRCVMYVLYI